MAHQAVWQVGGSFSAISAGLRKVALHRQNASFSKPFALTTCTEPAFIVQKLVPVTNKMIMHQYKLLTVALFFALGLLVVDEVRKGTYFPGRVRGEDSGQGQHAKVKTCKEDET